MAARKAAGILLFTALALIATSGARADKPNVLFIAIDDLRNDLGALAVAHALTPQLDAFAKTARTFSHHYVQVPTCGASRCALLRGRYPSQAAHLANNGIKSTSADWAAESLPGVFKRAGYQTLSLGKISHYPGNQTGKHWAEPPLEIHGVWDRAWIPDGPWKTPEAIMHGYANGVARQPGKSPPMEAFDGTDEAYPDAWVAAEAVTTLRELAQSKQAFFFGVGFFKPHLPFAAPKKWHDLHHGRVPDLPAEAAAKPAWPSGWHGSGEFRGNYGHENRRDPDTDAAYARRLREAYAASVSYTDAQIGRVLRALEESGLADNTLVVIWSDHGFLLGEHAIWGKHCLYEHALRSPLMIRQPGMRQAGVVSDALVETVDLLPTLADLCALPAPAGLDGRSLRPQIENPQAPAAKPAHGFWTAGQRSIRTERWRLCTDGQGGRLELFDYLNDPFETRNHAAEQPQVVRDLLAKLERVPAPAAPAAKPKKQTR
jgi:iduronate 2-sulfatase